MKDVESSVLGSSQGWLNRAYISARRIPLESGVVLALRMVLQAGISRSKAFFTVPLSA